MKGRRQVTCGPTCEEQSLVFEMLFIDTLTIEEGYKFDYVTTAYDPDLFEAGQRSWTDCLSIGDRIYNSLLIEELNNAFVLAATSALSKGWRHSSLGLGDFLDKDGRIQDKSVKEFLNRYGEYYKYWKDYPIVVVRKDDDQPLLLSILTENNSMCIRKNHDLFYLGKWPEMSICGVRHEG